MPVPEWPLPVLPPDTIVVVRAALGPLADEIVAAVGDARPEYAEVLREPEGVGIRLGIEQALHGFLDTIEHPERVHEETRDAWQALGRAEFQAGRSLEGLQAAFRTGARAAWRGAAELAAGAGVSARQIAALAEAIFVEIDELAAEVVDGYVRAQSDEAGERERLRRRLVSLLLDPDPHEPAAIGRAARAARWRVPHALAALALADDPPPRLEARLDPDVLAGTDAGGSWLLIPDPDGPGRLAELRRAVGDVPAALGPTLAPQHAARSLRWARLTLTLVQRGVLPAQGPTRTAEHLGTVLVLQDDELARTLVAERLAGLDGQAPADRERLTETLDAWLAYQRHTPSVAAALHVHPQTVRYRLGRLRELIGGALDTPDGRFELQVALRAARGLGVREPGRRAGPGPG